MSDFRAAVRRVVETVEPGHVVTYGEIAREAGSPGAARAVGNVLRDLHDVPWWRVVTASGRVNPHAVAEAARLLQTEGVQVRDGVVVDPDAGR